MASSKQIPAKCIHCAMLSMTQVRPKAAKRSLHGETGDNCYVGAVCRSRRSYACHQRSRNQARQQKYRERSTGIQADRAATQPIADLIVYVHIHQQALLTVRIRHLGNRNARRLHDIAQIKRCSTFDRHGDPRPCPRLHQWPRSIDRFRHRVIFYRQSDRRLGVHLHPIGLRLDGRRDWLTGDR